MVKYFHFHSTQGEIRDVVEPLVSKQCIFSRDGRQCRKRCQIGLSYCWIHLRSVLHLRIKDAGDMGKGLFADNGTTNNAVVFNSNEIILEYEGEPMNEIQRFQRYGDHTAPYGVGYNRDTFYDCGITRCAAGLINHRAHSEANCRFSVNTQNNRVRIKVQNRKKIRNGQQLTLSYRSQVGGNRYVLNEPGVQTYTSTRKRH
jgi:hypothetical protein